MNREVRVFDFDKTLTDQDTLFGFYKTVAGNDRIFFAKRLLLLVTGVLYKSGLIKNDMLKRIGISLFLKGKTRVELDDAARRYAEKIELNQIYFTHYQQTKSEKWIVSASPEIYLRYVFPKDYVAGTRFTYIENQVNGLRVNMFGQEKRRFLAEKGITHINELFTDSATDKPLMDIADKVYLVKNGELAIVKPKKSK